MSNTVQRTNWRGVPEESIILSSRDDNELCLPSKGRCTPPPSPNLTYFHILSLKLSLTNIASHFHVATPPPTRGKMKDYMYLTSTTSDSPPRTAGSRPWRWRSGSRRWPGWWTRERGTRTDSRTGSRRWRKRWRRAQWSRPRKGGCRPWGCRQRDAYTTAASAPAYKNYTY